VEKPRFVCPECGSSCGWYDYVGSESFARKRSDPNFHSVVRKPYLESGVPAWVAKEFGVSKWSDDF